MTIRGGDHPKQAMVLTPVSRLGPPPRSFAADAHDCIMVRSLWTYRIQGCGAILRARWQAPLGPLCCPTKKITGARSKSTLTENAPYKACSAFTRVAACTLALPPIRDTLIEGFSHFVTSMTAPIASGWSGCRVGLAPTGKRRLVTAHTLSRHRRPCRTIAGLHSENAAGIQVRGSVRRASSIANLCLLKYILIGGDGPSRSPLDSG